MMMKILYIYYIHSNDDEIIIYIHSNDDKNIIGVNDDKFLIYVYK